MFLEDGFGLAAVSDVAEEEDNAIIKWAALNGEPEVQGISVEGLELARDAFLHGAM